MTNNNQDGTRSAAADAIYSIGLRGRAVEVPQIGIRSDDREVPHPTDGNATDHFAGFVNVQYSRPIVDQSGTPITGPRSLQGLFAAFVLGRRLGVIVAPQSTQVPSFWFTLDLRTASISAQGLVGTFTKRPASVVVEAPGMTASFQEPARLLAGGRVQSRQSEAMLEVLNRAAVSADGLDRPVSQPGQVPPPFTQSAPAWSSTQPEPFAQPPQPVQPPQPAPAPLSSQSVPFAQPPPPTATSAAGSTPRPSTGGSDALWIVMWAVAGVIGLTGFVLGMLAGPLLYLAMMVIVGLAWWPVVKVGGFFFGLVELLEIPPVAVAVFPWVALIGAAVFGLPS